ncbi:MAG: threonylcarbamoyl-AMP synthase [Clostridia bacterium]|nr:threonylcarbamoyl-AMP synthase [Clostridia bacterium]
MNTLHLTDSPADLAVAARLLADGEPVAIPTETVYGLAADAQNEQAVAKIFAAKGRPQDNPLIVHVASWEQLLPLVAEVPPCAKALADAYWPGPLTMIFKRSEAIPASVSGGLDTLAVRWPAHPVAQALIRQSGRALAAPSANLSGSPSPTNAARTAADMDGRIPAIVDGGDCEVGVESTVVTLVGDVPQILRPGAVTAEQIAAVCGECRINQAVIQPLGSNETAASPGMKYKHYAPTAKVILLNGTPKRIVDYINAHATDGVWALAFDGETDGLAVPHITYGARADEAAQAHAVFEALRQADERGATVLYTSCPRADGLGLAVYNRLLRAAAFEVITLD